VAKELQTSLDFWEVGLRASRGAILPEKTAWNLTSFKWSNGTWKYQTIADSPVLLTVKDIHREPHTLHWLEYNESMTTLGVEIAPGGDMDQQIKTLWAKLSTWAAQIKDSKLP
jgi:hypothetical protein